MDFFYKSGSFDLDYLSVSRAKANIGNVARVCLRGLLLTSVILSAGVAAQSISPQMMQQLQSMPRAQQEALAKQYGIDLDQVLGGGRAKGAAEDIGMPGEPLDQRSLLDTDLDLDRNYKLFQEKIC